MLVILPVCGKDKEAALRNLHWLVSFKKPTRLTCIVSHDDTAGDLTEVLGLSRQFFGEVKEHNYRRPPVSDWPMGANWAFRQAAARVYTSERQPWLWWEQDAVPLHPEVFERIEQEYNSCGKSFLGAASHTSKGHHLNGVAVYPHDLPTRFPDMLMATRLPFDVVGGEKVLAQSHQSELLQHLWSLEPLVPNAPAPTFPNREALSVISDGTMLFHRCKDGSLIEQWKNRNVEPRKPQSKPWEFWKHDGMDLITVVITNYQRPDFLWNAFQSCIKAGVKNIVVSSSGANDAVCEIHRRMVKECPDTTITSISDDLGCNETWLRGVRETKTEWVHILHDDDMVLPDFRQLGKLVQQHKSAGFFHWDATSHGINPPRFFRSFEGNPAGLLQSRLLSGLLEHRKARSISPVAGLFQRTHLLSVLEEAETAFQSREFHVSPKMMVGNDLLIWLKAVEKYPEFYYVNKCLVAFGFWLGSTTCKDVQSGDNNLVSIYNRVRDYAAKTSIKPEPVVVVSDSRLDLGTVTLLAIEVKYPAHTVESILEAISKVRFKSVVMLTDLRKYRPDKSLSDRIKFVQHEESDYRPMVRGACYDHEVACIRKPIEYIDGGTHILFMEWDSGVRCPESWNPKWLEYDFIGAPWPPRAELGWPACTVENCVGNTGFSLRSSKFCELSRQADDEHRWDVTRCVHDSWLCLTMRPWLVERGAKFAPADVAAAFSNENRLHRKQFGFHGKQTYFLNHWGTPENPVWRKH